MMRLPLALIPALAASPLLYSAVSSYAAKKAVGDAVGSALHFILSSGWYVTPALGAAAVGAAIVFLRRGDPQARFVLVVVTAGGLALLCFSAVATVTAQYSFALFPFGSSSTAQCACADRRLRGALRRTDDLRRPERKPHSC